MAGKVEKFPGKPRDLPHGAFQAAVADILSLEGMEIETFAIVVWYKGGAIVKNVPRNTLPALWDFVRDEIVGGELSDGA